MRSRFDQPDPPGDLPSGGGTPDDRHRYRCEACQLCLTASEACRHHDVTGHVITSRHGRVQAFSPVASSASLVGAVRSRP